MMAAWNLLVALATVVAIIWLAWTAASVIESARYQRRRVPHLRLVKPRRRFVIRFRRTA
jgi:hypothetical protein